MTFNVTEFWRNPDISQIENPEYRRCYLPEYYIDQPEATKDIVDAVTEFVDKDDSIFEIGCSVGRNLAALKELGYKSLWGLEINKEAVQLGKEIFDLEGINITSIDIERFEYKPGFDCIFTQSVLMHLPPSSEFVFEKIANMTHKYLITRENERTNGKMQWRRSYGKIFTELGMREIKGIKLNRSLLLRVFEHEQN